MVTVPPTVLWLVESAVGAMRPRAGRALHAGLVSFLIASMVWQAAHRGALTGDAFSTIALLASFGGLLALYLRTRWLPTVTRVLAVTAPIVAISFLATSPVNRVFGAETIDSPAVRGTSPVVLIVFDELPLATLIGPDGKIDKRLFPNFARLADDSTWYRGTRTVSDHTLRALPAILSGDYPTTEQIPTLADFPRNIFTLLGSAGKVSSDEALTDLCRPPICPDRFSFRTQMTQLLQLGSTATVTLPFGIVESIASRLQAGAAPSDTATFGEFLDLMGSPPERWASLAVYHEMLPHPPWRFLPSGQTYADPGSFGKNGDVWHGPFVKLGFQRHVLQTQYVDRQLGDVMSAMKRSGLYDDAVLAVTSDHGGAFLSDLPRRELNESVSGWILPVPLFVRRPGQTTGRVDSRPVRTIDILPTLVQATGARMPWKLDGRLPGAPRDPDLDGTYLAASGPMRIESSVVDAALKRAIGLRNRILEHGTPFAVGGYAHLIGRRAATLNARPLASQLDSPGLDEVDPAAPQLNSFVTGSLPDFAGEPGDPLAFVVNGRIVATGEAFDDTAPADFASVLPVRSLRHGRNRFEVYPLARGSGG